mgnify:CR=1 FL=1
MSLQSYVKTVLADLVDHPGDLKLTEVAGDKLVIFELRCHAEDIGKVIGKNGKTIGAVRTLRAPRGVVGQAGAPAPA